MDLSGDKVKLVIELNEEGTERMVVDLVRKNGLDDNVYVISFWHSMVKRIKSLHSHIKTGVLLVGCPVDTCVATRALAEALVMKYSFVNKDFVEMAHGDGLKVFVWNIDEPRLLGPYVDMGVDGIGSNDPRILVESAGTRRTD
jgi:glycerophosphoryl diester phosphodiesterase